MKTWADTRELDTIAADIPSEDFVFAIGNTIVIDGGTVIISCFLIKIKTKT
jgi:hypothetical protein